MSAPRLLGLLPLLVVACSSAPPLDRPADDESTGTSSEPSGDTGETDDGGEGEDSSTGDSEDDGGSPDVATDLPDADPPPPEARPGIWVDPEALADYPASGPAWEAIEDEASGDLGTADVSDQDSEHDTRTLAAALVCVRLEDPGVCDKARAAVVSAIGTEEGGRWLAVGRNMVAYVIAADLLGLRADDDPESDGSKVEAWFANMQERTLQHNNDPDEQVPLVSFGSGSNASAQEGAVYIALAAFLEDEDRLEHGWETYRTYVCDPGATDPENIDLDKGIQAGWAHDDDDPCAIAPAGAEKVVPGGLPGAGETHRLDGAIINDMRRGDDYQWPPVYTQYPWVGIEGFVSAAVLLDRAGYPAFQIADEAPWRALDYLWFLREQTGDDAWFDGKRADEMTHLVNVAYDEDWPTQEAVGAGRIVGFTDWTHPEGL